MDCVLKLQCLNQGVQKMANWIVLFNINIIIITPREYGSRLGVHRNNLGVTANTPNSSEICTFEWFDVKACWTQPNTLQDILGFCSTPFGALSSTGKVVSEHLRAHRFPFSLSGSIWEHLEGSVWPFRVAESFSYDFETILHFADETQCQSFNLRVQFTILVTCLYSAMHLSVEFEIGVWRASGCVVLSSPFLECCKAFSECRAATQSIYGLGHLLEQGGTEFFGTVWNVSRPCPLDLW